MTLNLDNSNKNHFNQSQKSLHVKNPSQDSFLQDDHIDSKNKYKS